MSGPYGAGSCCGILPWDEWLSNATFLSQGGWSYGVPLASLNYFNMTCASGTTESDTSNYTFQDPSEERHSLYLASNNHQCGNSTYTTGGDSRYYGWFAGTGTGGWNPALTVSDVDGTVFQFANPMRHEVGGYWSALPDYIEDRNGNQATVYNAGLHGGTVGAFTITDPAGRTSISANGFGPSGSTNTLTFSGSSTYRIAWETIAANYTVSSQQVESTNGVTCAGIPSVSGNQAVISSITLPNGEQYSFQYNSWGLLSEIVYPTGAWVKYNWKMSDQLSDFIIFDGYSYNSTTKLYTYYHNACAYHYSVPVVWTRNVGLSGSSAPVLTQTFGPFVTNWDTSLTTWDTKSTTVETTDTNGTFQTVYNYGYAEVASMPPPYGSGWPNQIPLESSVKYYNWGNTSSPLRTVNKTWTDMYDLASEQTVLNDDNNLTSQTTYGYQFAGSSNLGGGFLSQLVQENDYDYGLNLLRSTVTTYQSFSTGLGVIADKPCKVVTNDGNNNRFAETDYFYDGSTTLCGTITSGAATTGVTVVPGTHDESKFGPTATTPRGNVAQKTLWASTGASPLTKYTYALRPARLLNHDRSVRQQHVQRHGWV